MPSRKQANFPLTVHRKGIRPFKIYSCEDLATVVKFERIVRDISQDNIHPAIRQTSISRLERGNAVNEDTTIGILLALGYAVNY
jgi:hypothetical protein